MTNTTNTNSARKVRANVALFFLGVAGFISLILITDAIKYGESFEFYVGGMALAEAIGALTISVVLFAWNAVTYRAPRYARRSR
jgi:hypothetical protein